MRLSSPILNSLQYLHAVWLTTNRELMKEELLISTNTLLSLAARTTSSTLMGYLDYQDGQNLNKTGLHRSNHGLGMFFTAGWLKYGS